MKKLLIEDVRLVRRIGELRCVVIQKQNRRTLRMKENEEGVHLYFHEKFVYGELNMSD